MAVLGGGRGRGGYGSRPDRRSGSRGQAAIRRRSVRSGVAIGRIAGFALLSIGLLCWMGRREPGNLPILASMFSYNLPVTLYLAYLGIGGVAVGRLLWPAVAFHAVMTNLFAACAKAQVGRAGTGWS